MLSVSLLANKTKKNVSSSLEPSSTETLIKIISLNDEQNDLKVFTNNLMLYKQMKTFLSLWTKCSLAFYVRKEYSLSW